jgi:anti-sigma28 factor (negative regulator of flagellin synthesis)
MTTIRLKRGTGVPSSLEYGEIAVDTGAQLLYAGTADNKVIELSGGEISWNQLVDLPDWIIEIDPNKPDSINLSELEKQVNANAEEVGKLQTDVNQIWSTLHEISQLASSALDKANDNAEKIAINTEEIDALKNEISAIESGLIFGGVYSPATNQITQVDKYASDRGFQEGAVLTTNTTAEQQGIYFIVSVSGDAVTGEAVKAGDWLIANSLSWTVVGYGFETITIDQVAGLAGELDTLSKRDQDLEARVTALEEEIDGGTYAGTPPNFRS